LRKAQNRIMDLRPYANRLSGVLKTVVAKAGVEDAYFRDVVENPQRILYVVVGSDRGLCGGFNTNLFKTLEADIRHRFPQQSGVGTVSLLCLGRKANDYFRKRGYRVVADRTGFMDRLSFDQPASIMGDVRK